MKLNRHRGFSLLEMLVVVAIGFAIASMSVVALMPLLQKNHVDAAYDTTMMALRNTRYLAITQSHQYYVNFNPAGFPAGTIQVTYQPPAVPVGSPLPPVQQVALYTLPPDISFGVMNKFPANAPDSFGAGLVPIDFGQGLGAGSLNYVCFLPDGSSQDNLGNYNSGVVYLIRTNTTDLYASKAVTVWGATGRVRGWRLGHQAGQNIWEQQ
jgi:prepilin-type N-terminal cleavage/methylation domain-containing protein